MDEMDAVDEMEGGGTVDLLAARMLTARFAPDPAEPALASHFLI
jgi:hypothetical protein